MRAGLFLLALGVSAAAAPQDEAPEETMPPLVEGPLANDCFLPTVAAANEALAAGDAALARAAVARAAGRTAEVGRETTAAFEGWFTALEVTSLGDAVWLQPQADGERRATEGVECAVLRRLGALVDADRREWQARFGDPAAAALGPAIATAGPAGETRLGEVARRFPATDAAARASLLLCDRALERGERVTAHDHARRGLEHAVLADAPPDLREALGARRAWLSPPSTPAPTEPWQTAGRLEALGALLLPDEEGPRGARGSTFPERGVRPGLLVLDADELVIQTALRLHRVEVPAGGAPRVVSSFDLRELVWDAFGEVERPRTGREAPGWAHQPAAAGGDLYLVHGRAAPREGGVPNTLLCLRPPAPGEWSPGLSVRGQRPPAPEIRWAVSGDRHLDSDGEVSTPPALAAFAEAEFHPAPLVVGGLVVVQARLLEGDARHWLLAFERASGTLRWKRLLAKGSDLSPSQGRFGTGTGRRLAPMPVVMAGTRLFAGTHLGAGALVEVADGRPCWTIKNRRRPAGQAGWGGGSVPWFPGEGGPDAAGADGVLLWAPADSDRLYTLRASPFAGAEAAADDLFLAPPRAIQEAEVLVGGDAAETIVLGRAGADRALMAWRPERRRRIASVYVGPDESFRGRGLVSETRVYGCTDRGLYLFDRPGELYFLDYRPLDRPGESAGGDVFAHGSLVLVLGQDTLWSFRTHPR